MRQLLFLAAVRVLGPCGCAPDSTSNAHPTSGEAAVSGGNNNGVAGSSVTASGGAGSASGGAGSNAAGTANPSGGTSNEGGEARGGAGGVAATDQRPNVILLVADDLGYSDVGSFGGEISPPATPRAFRA